MYVDCASCPGRPVACGDCAMTVLLGTPSWDDGGQRGPSGLGLRSLAPDAELDAAIDVFVSAAMASSTAARSARSGKTAVHRADSDRGPHILRAG